MNALDSSSSGGAQLGGCLSGITPGLVNRALTRGAMPKVRRALPSPETMTLSYTDLSRFMRKYKSIQHTPLKSPWQSGPEL